MSPLRSWMLVFCLLAGFTLMNNQGVQAEQRVALVIGNGAYKSAALRHPLQEAEAMTKALKECRFRVTTRINCTQQEMEQAIRDFGSEILQGGMGLFYYGGHGVLVKGRNYLIPVDADIQGEEEVKFKAVDAEMVLNKMASAGNRLNIMILDACRNNPFRSRFRSPTRGLKKMDVPVGTLLAYSTDPGDVAEDGVYTPSLIKHMKTPGLLVEQVFKRVRDDVMRATGDDQVPWESTSLRGDFFFVSQDDEKSTFKARIDLPYLYSSAELKSIVINPAGTNASRFAMFTVVLGLMAVDHGKNLPEDVTGDLAKDADVLAKIGLYDRMIKSIITQIMQKKTIDQLDAMVIHKVKDEIRVRLNKDVFQELFQIDGYNKKKIQVQSVMFPDFIIQ